MDGHKKPRVHMNYIYIYKAAHFLQYINTHLIYLYELCIYIYIHIYIYPIYINRHRRNLSKLARLQFH